MRAFPLRLAFVRRIVVASGCVLFSLALWPGEARAENGTWNTTTSGLNWSDSANWLNGDIANGVDAVANFATLNIGTTSTTTVVTVYVDQNYTIGTMKLADTDTSSTSRGLWSISGSGGVLTLETTSGKPVFDVSPFSSAISFPYAVVNVPLAGTQGFEKTGTGRLTIGSANNSRLSGEILVSGGALNIIGAVNNATVTLASGTLLTIGNSGGSPTYIAGLNSTGTNGSVSWSSNNRFLVVTGSGSYSYGGKINAASSGASDVGVEARLGAGGVQTFTNVTETTYAGGTIASSGTLRSAGSSATGTPFGTGIVVMAGGTLEIAPTVASGAVNYTGVTGLIPAATRSVASYFTYGGGTFILDKGNASSLTYTIGNTTAAKDAVLVRNRGNGTMVLEAAGGIAALGTTENFVVNGNGGTDGVTTNNGMATAAIVGRISQSDTNEAATFLTYGAVGKTGFSEVTYSTSTDINGGTAYSDTRIFQATSGTTNALTADAAVYSLRVDGATVSGAHTLSIGSNSATNPATGIILNGGAITVTTIAIGDSPTVIYTSGEGATISSNITASGTLLSATPGVSFMGPGVLTLTGTNTFHSATINGGTVSVASDAQLGSKSSGTTDAGTLTIRDGTLRITGSTDLTGRAIILNEITQGSTSRYSGTEGGTFEIVGAGTTVTFLASGAYSKNIQGTGSLEKKGAGTMVLGGNASNSYTGRTIVSEGTLLLNGTAGMNMISSTNNSGDSLDLTDVQVKTGGTLQWGASNQIIDSAKVALAGGVMDLNGKSEGSTSAAGLGFLNVFASSTLDFGEGDNANVVRFASINLHTAGTVLSILNWNGVKWLGGGSEQLLFGGLAAEFTSLFGQNDVSFDGVSGYSTVQYSGYYEVVAVPEPGTVALLGVTLLAGLRMVMRRRMAAVA